MLLRAVALYFTLSGLSMQAQSWNWATALFGTGQPRVEAVAALADGGAFVCGEFNDTLRTDADTIVTNGSWDGFLARMDDSGAVLWLIGIGGEFEDELNDIVVDANGNGFAAATFRDTVSWNGTQILGNGAEATLVKFDMNGSVLWYRRAVGYTFGYTVSVSSNGTAFLGGVINGSAVFSGTTITNSAGIFNAFIVRYTSGTGALVDADVVSGSSGDFGAYGMDADSDGNVYFTGYSRPQQNPYVGTFMAKIAFGSGTGWIQTVSSAFGDLYGRDASVTSDGHVYFTGNIYNNVTWMGQPLGQYGRYNNAYLARFTIDGTLDWVKQVGWTGTDLGLGVVADGLGHAYWTGEFYRQADFDTVHVDSFNALNSQDIYVARTAPNDTTMFVNTAGGYGDEMATAIDKRVDGPVIVGGTYLGFPFQFGDLPSMNLSGNRLFVASMAGPDDDLATVTRTSSLNEPELHVYPVPAHDELFVAMHGGRGAMMCSILDNSGRVVHRSTLGAPFGSIDIAQLATGLYTLMCVDSEHAARTTRFAVY